MGIYPPSPHVMFALEHTGYILRDGVAPWWSRCRDIRYYEDRIYAWINVFSYFWDEITRLTFWFYLFTTNEPISRISRLSMINVNDPCKCLLEWISCNFLKYLWGKMVSKKVVFLSPNIIERRKFVKIKKKNLIINNVTIGKKKNNGILFRCWKHIYCVKSVINLYRNIKSSIKMLLPDGN